ncbi:MAG TPA: FAD-binding protein [Chloroflexota bacterium]|nr:FAD-binding protein [Chloroflexota bacterium]
MSATTSEHRTAVCNVLVIGTGAAGLRAAIAAHQAGCEVIVLGKRLAMDAHTVLAAGGINAALGSVDPQDSWEQHFADTVREGYFLGQPRTVELMAREAPAAVLELAAWGAPFARTAQGTLDQRFFGAHTYRRTCYAGDATGRAVLSTLAGKVASLGIPIHEHQYVSHLLVHQDAPPAGGAAPAAARRCFGAMAFDLQSGQRTVYLADAVVLAAGGHTRLWRRSSSRRDENTGDGMYLALQAGCALADVELVQFHPTGMIAPESMAGTLVTEAVRGEGGRLYNRLGERFMARYDPQRLELSTRDRVALANYTEIVEGRGTPDGGVYLDVSHLPKDVILQQLPRMYRQFMEAQLLDIAHQPMEVAPTAHYSMGGVVVDPDSHATAVAGLFAAGEVTSGLHGANRLGGNSLAETIVFGRRAGEHAARYSATLELQPRSRAVIAAAHDDLNALIREGDELARPLQCALRDTMWECCGVVRDEPRLRRGLAQIKSLQAAAAAVDVRPSSEGFQDLALALDLRAALVVAEATILGALERRESRGAHQRADFPALDPAMAVNFHLRRQPGGALVLTAVPLPPIPEGLRALAQAPAALPVQGRLLE